MKNVQCKIKNLYGEGFGPIKLLVIVALGVIIGVGAYVFYKNPTSIIPWVPNEKLAEPGETTETTTEKAVETGGKTGVTEETGSKQSTPPESAMKSEKSSTKGNFSQAGALMAREDGWTLLWDEPGRMAVNIKLKFTDQSICYLGGEKKDCGLINMGPQSYDRVSVEGNRTGDEVTVTKLEELKLP